MSFNSVTSPLNQGQTEAENAFFAFLFNDEKEFIISGPGGVGKTHLMGHLIDTTIPRYFDTCKLMGIEPKYDEVHMRATTNKAAEVLGKATGRPSGTIQSFLNLKVQDDMTTGVSKLTKTNQWVVHSNMIIFIDECSMIDGPLYKYIQEGTHNCKIVYVGDHCQLAPVMEAISPVYKQGIAFYELTEPMRNAGQPALINLCQQLRTTVETGIFNPIQIIPGVIDHVDDAGLARELQHYFVTPEPEARALSFTNSRVLLYNDHIRHLRGLPPEFTEGETLVNNYAVKVGKELLRVEDEVTILTIYPNILSDVLGQDQDGDDIIIHYRNMDVKVGLGAIYKDVRLPVDREYTNNLKKGYAQRKNWNRHFYIKEKYPDLRERDGSTIYKVQGSTHNVVIIDLTDISNCRKADQTARMLYVAGSRARHRIITYGKLADKYGGLIF